MGDSVGSLRKIVGLRWARQVPRPGFISRSKNLQGPQARGLAYERACAKCLPRAQHGPWFEFEDSLGRGWCQPDLLQGNLVLECKLTWVPEAEVKLGALYLPVLEAALGGRFFPVVVCKALTPGVPLGRVFGRLGEAIGSGHDFPVVHWIGRGPLV